MRDLGKWPRLLVTGTPVSEEQADEILVRTNLWYSLSNDKDWELVVAELAGISIGAHGMYDYQSVRRFEQRHGVLRLEYLHNYRIASAWIDGPHGWCDWNGHIGCSTFNIGKWPTADSVTGEWTAIATAFPYLDLTAQLVGDEGAAEDPAIQWRIHRGQVDVDTNPTELLRPVAAFDAPAAIHRIQYDAFRERGIYRERLERALNRVRAQQTTGHSEAITEQ